MPKNTRIGNIRTKFETIVPMFKTLASKDDAYNEFSHLFTEKQMKLLDIAVERYFDNTPGDTIGGRIGCSREYIRQCEEKALKIISENL